MSDDPIVAALEGHLRSLGHEPRLIVGSGCFVLDKPVRENIVRIFYHPYLDGSVVISCNEPYVWKRLDTANPRFFDDVEEALDGIIDLAVLALP